jgi:hypothetical protein
VAQTHDSVDELDRFVTEENIARYLKQLHSCRDPKERLRLTELVRSEVSHLAKIGLPHRSERLSGWGD